MTAEPHLPKKFAFYCGKVASWPFVAMVSNSLEDQELRTAAEFVRNEPFLAALPDQITEEAAERLTGGRQILKLNYNLFVWWLD